jgi:hypothetical protein
MSHKLVEMERQQSRLLGVCEASRNDDLPGSVADIREAITPRREM